MTLPKITNKQFTILAYLYQFHFIDRIQIQTLMGHKNHKRIQTWLNDLLAKGCVGRIYSKKMPDNTKPAIYFLAKYGRKILQQAQARENTNNPVSKKDDQDRDNHPADQIDVNQFVGDTGMIFSTHGLKSSYRDRSRTPLFRLQCQALVDCFISIKHYMTNNGYDFSYYSRFECFDYGFLKELTPDAFLSQMLKNGHKKDYIIYFITHRLPRRIIRFKLRYLINFFWEGNWDRQPSPKILLICSNPYIRNYSLKVVESKLEKCDFPENIHISLTTLHEFMTLGLGERIWYQPKNEEDY